MSNLTNKTTLKNSIKIKHKLSKLSNNIMHNFKIKFKNNLHQFRKFNKDFTNCKKGPSKLLFIIIQEISHLNNLNIPNLNKYLPQ